MSALREHLLWHGFEAPGVVSLWDGGYMKTFAFRGPDIASASPAERVRVSERLNDVVRQLGPRWAWHKECQNVEMPGYPKSQWPTAASALLDAERAAECTQVGAQFDFRHYLTLTEGAPNRALAATKELITSGSNSDPRQRQRDDFRSACDGISKQLRGVVNLEELDDDDTATYLHSTVSTQRHRVCADDHEILSESLSDETFTRGLGLARLGGSYVSVLTLGGFPRRAYPQMLDALGRLRFEFRWVTRWVSIHTAKIQKMMNSRELKALGQIEYFQDMALARLSGKEKEAPRRKNRAQEEMAAEAGEAMTRLGTRGFGHMTTTFIVAVRPVGRAGVSEDVSMDQARRRCLANTSDLQTLLQQHSGLVVRREFLEQVKPWRMALPGNRELGRRTFTLSTRNLADLMPTSSVWQGSECDAELAKTTGTRRAWMYTADPVPMRINTDVPGGAAHTLLFGATGQAAKSTLANHLATQFLGWPNAQIISFSVGRSELGPVILNGGAVYSIGAPNSLAFQPLAYVDEPNELRAQLEWLQVCLDVLGEETTPARTEALTASLRLVATYAQARRTMTELVRDLSTRSPDLALALKVFTHAGHYGHIFDGDCADATKRHRWTMFDLSQLLKMSTRAIIPACAHMLHRVERWFDGSPTLLHMDEVQEWLGHEQLQTFVKKGLNTRRKDNVRLLMVTPTPSNLAQHPSLMASAKSACATKIYGPDSEALTQSVSYADLGVGQAELEQIAVMPLGSYLLKNMRGSRQFALKAGPIALALTGMSRPDELTLLAEIAERCSNADEALWELLDAKGLSDTARRLLGCKSEKRADLADAAQ